MAEIRVEPKRGGLAWLWVVIIAVLAAIAIWYFVSNTNAVPATTPADTLRTSSVERSAPSVAGDPGSMTIRLTST